MYDFLRLLYARLGRLHCPTCGKPVTSQTREMIVQQVLKLEDRRKVLVLAPLIRNQPGSHADVLARVGKDGFVRARVDGELVDAASPPELSAVKPHSIEVVIDRLIIKEGIRNRVEESIDLALQVGQGQCILSHEIDGTWRDRLYSSRLACIPCATSFPSIEPGDFSFSSPRGACPTCQGLGTISEPQKSIAAGSKENPTARNSIASPCPHCQGHRLSPLPLAVLIEGLSIGQLTAMFVPEVLDRVRVWQELISMECNSGANYVNREPDLQPAYDEAADHLARSLIPEITSRLQVMLDLGLEYLTLDRAGDSLSAGEFQRARLTSSLGSQLTGVCYVIDEPTAGLHAADTIRLMKTLLQLRDQGNTLIVVEHDLELIRQSDHTIEIGPGAGIDGGRMIAACHPKDLESLEFSITARELRRRASGFEKDNSQFLPKCSVVLTGASLHNLRDVSLTLPMGGLVCVTGISGSGKTSLLMQTLVPAISRVLGHGTAIPGPFRELKGAEYVTRLVVVDQRPLGRSERSTPATYSGIWDEVRKVFAKTKEARIRGYAPRRFSPQHAEGRCPKCAGRGSIDLDKRELVEWPIRCPECAGSRFNRQTLALLYRGQSVADILKMTFQHAADFFANLPRLDRPLRLFCDLGLGYLQLGQPATTLSGGEAQRVKLATELWKSESGMPTLFILDEPTSGLHAADVTQLLRAIRGLIVAGNSVVVIEHHLDMIAAADWVIDIGPGPGANGGRIVFEGPPAMIVRCDESLTGRALRSAFQ